MSKDFTDEEQLYICDLADISFKDIHQEMEHPFYALSKKPDLTVRKYNHNGNTIQIKPSLDGMPTIYDKDVIVFCISKLMWQKREKLPMSKTVMFKPSEFIKFTSRNNSAKIYKSLLSSIERLQGMQIKTNIKTGKERNERVFSLIDSGDLVYKENEDGSNGRLKYAYVTLSDWVYNSIEANEVLTLNRDYFKLSRPTEKRLYEMFRKHCGNQAKFEISLDKLHYKSGSLMTKAKFRFELKGIAKEQTIPDYNFRITEDDIIVVVKTDYDETHLLDDLPPEVSSDAIEKAKKLLNLSDVSYYVNEFYKFYKSKKAKLLSVDAAFIGFVEYRSKINSFNFSDYY